MLVGVDVGGMMVGATFEQPVRITANKTEKIHWFEKKLNKWVKLFEESEKENGHRHNDMVDKINEVDTFYKGACKGLDLRVKALEKRKKGGKVKNDGNEDKESEKGKSSDNVSDISR